MQHLDGRLEHLDEFQQPLVGQAKAAGVAVGIRVILRQGFQLADVYLADQRRDVLVVLVAGFGLGDGDLLEHRRLDPDDAKPGQIALELLEPLERPGTGDAGEVARRDAVFLLQHGAVAVRVEQSQRRFVDRRVLEGVDGKALHQRLESLGDGGFAAADRAEQVEHLLALFESLRRVTEVGHDLLDRILHAVELLERRVALQQPVGEQP